LTSNGLAFLAVVNKCKILGFMVCMVCRFFVV
jgi:hypothetical protein